MKILVTGASGIIGKYLLNSLGKQYPKAKLFGSIYKNIPKSKAGINFIPYSEIINSNQKFDQIWHFATYGQPLKFMKNWRDVIDLNTNNIFDLCNLLTSNGKFLYASTSEIYGSNNNSETEAPTSFTCTPRSTYIDSKRLGESIIYSILPKESYRIFRICLAYSPYFRSSDNRVLYELILKGISNNEIKLIDQGDAIRQYIYIEDACNMMLEISNKRYEELLLDNAPPIFNISNSFEPITIYELAKLIGENLNVPVKKGEPNSNIFFAPKIVKVHPERFLKIFPNYNFINIKDGIKKVCDVSKKNFSNYQNLNA